MITGPQTAVTIESLSQAQNSSGALIDTWTTFASVSGVMRQLSAAERFVEGKDTVFGDYEFTAGYVSGVTEVHRVTWGTRHFNITGVDNALQMGVFIKLVLREIKA